MIDLFPLVFREIDTIMMYDFVVVAVVALSPCVMYNQYFTSPLYGQTQ